MNESLFDNINLQRSVYVCIWERVRDCWICCSKCRNGGWLLYGITRGVGRSFVGMLAERREYGFYCVRERRRFVDVVYS